MGSTARPVALVTGAAGGGIGTSCCLRFAKEGYDVVATDIVNLENIKRQVEDRGVRCLPVNLDVCKKESVDNAVKLALSTFGRIDVLVNNAGRSFGTDITELCEEMWDANVTLVLKSVYLVTRAVLPAMLSRKKGAIVNVSSVNGQTGIGEEAYSAAKAGVINLTKNLGVRYGPQGIRCNAVAPGTIQSAQWDERLEKDPEVLNKLKRYYPLGRLGRAEDVANAIWFLASEQASWITGTTLNVDGGLMCGDSGLQVDLVPKGAL